MDNVSHCKQSYFTDSVLQPVISMGQVVLQQKLGLVDLNTCKYLMTVDIFFYLSMAYIIPSGQSCCPNSETTVEYSLQL